VGRGIWKNFGAKPLTKPLPCLPFSNYNESTVISALQVWRLPIMKRSQLVVAVLLTLICGAGPLHAQSAPQAFVNLYCSSCHNERTKSGNLTLTGLTVAENPEIWEKVVKKQEVLNLK
jgi:hypothetical protein